MNGARRNLPYRPPEEGRDFWIKDHALADPDAVRARCLERRDWILGFPHAEQTWPGMRARDALLPEELEPIEAWVRKAAGVPRLWGEETSSGARLDHNVAQLVGGAESGPRPHSDSRRLCRHAAVLYLTPNAPADAGTSFFRLRHEDGSLGGNYCPAPHANLVEALRVRRLPPQAWHEEMRVPNVYNRMLLYKADIVHGATRYFGEEMADRRLTAVFFWMNES